MSPLHPFVHQMNDVAGCTAAAAGPVAGIVVEKRSWRGFGKIAGYLFKFLLKFMTAIYI